MTDDTAIEWLAVAANELAGYRQWLVESGLRAARRKCTHHGQIIPTALEHMQAEIPWEPLQPVRAVAKELPPPEIQGLIASVTKALTEY